MGERYPVGLVGERFYRDAVARLQPGRVALIVPEPDNPHDSLAVAVTDALGNKIGHLARDCWLRAAIHDEGKRPTATILRVDRSDPANPQVVIEVDLRPNDDDAGLSGLLGGLAAQPTPSTGARPERTGVMRLLFGP